MKVIQASWSSSSGLYLWGETSDLTRLPGAGLVSVIDRTISPLTCNEARNQIHSPLHPNAIPHSLLERIIASLEIEDATQCFIEVSLPTDATGNVISSPRLLNNTDGVETLRAPNQRKEHKQSWSVPALSMNPLLALEFLTASRDTFPEGFIFDKSVNFWTECSKLLLELLTRGMFLPSITKQGNEHLASWELVISETEDIERLDLLCHTIPTACFCIVENGGSQSIEPYRLITSFLEIGADNLIRSFLSRNSLCPTIKDYSPHSKRHVCLHWLNQLTSQDSKLSQTRASILETLEFEQQIKRWKSKIATGREHHEIIPCFCLHAPHSKDINTEIGLSSSASPVWELKFCIQSQSAPEVMLEAAQLWNHDLGFLARTNYSSDDLEELLLCALARAATFCTAIRVALSQSHPTGAHLTSEEAHEFLMKTKPLLEKSGFSVILPSWWSDRNLGIGLHLHLGNDNTSSDNLSNRSSNNDTSSESSDTKEGHSLVGLGLHELVSFSWRVAIGEHLLSLEEFEKLVNTNSPLVSFGDEWYEISQDKAKSTIDFLQEQRDRQKIPLLEALRLAFGAEQKTSFSLPIKGITASGWIGDLLDRGGAIATQVEQPTSFKGELRPYQKEGLSWLVFLSESGIGGCLADDMGLGKTIQLLAYLAHEHETKAPGDVLPCLLCAPMSVVDNWEREARVFTPHLKVYVHHGPQRLSGQEFVDQVSNYDLVVTTYSLAYRDEIQISQVAWGAIVLDEAQNIKNLHSKQSQSIRRIATSQESLPNRRSSCHRFALTGTPIENRLEELWSIFDFINSGFLGSIESFKTQFVSPIEKYRDPNCVSRLSSLVKPFLLRRLKTDPNVISDLPEKIEMDVFTPLSTEQVSLYQKVLSSMLNDIDRSDGIHRKGLVLAMISRLKQICNHPALFLQDMNPSPERSGKLQCLEELLEVIVSEGDKVLVFTQFAQMGKLLKHRLQEFLGEEVLFLHGGLSKQARSDVIDKFQNQDKPQVFLLSLKAGGYGLNLTRASQVIHFDQWWNPAVHDQATDRAHRIGQRNSVQVRRFICKGTLEERIIQMLKSKQDLANLIVAETKSLITQMTTSELRNLLELTTL